MKHTLRFLATVFLLPGLLASCGSKDKTTDTAATTTATSDASTPTVATPTEEAKAPEAETPTAASAAVFDITKVPVSSANLGQYPYLGSLKGYRVPYASDSVAYEFDRSYLYDGQNLASVEGRVLRRRYSPTDRNKQASDLMIRRNYENLITSLGGVKVFSGEIPDEAIKKVGSNVAEKGGLTGYSGEYDIYVIRQKDKEVWVQLQKPSTNDYYLSVTEKAAMPQQVSVIPATEIKKN